jgi:hypothetical protein
VEVASARAPRAAARRARGAFDALEAPKLAKAALEDLDLGPAGLELLAGRLSSSSVVT